jgi:hypothetical protein
MSQPFIEGFIKGTKRGLSKLTEEVKYREYLEDYYNALKKASNETLNIVIENFKTKAPAMIPFVVAVKDGKTFDEAYREYKKNDNV